MASHRRTSRCLLRPLAVVLGAALLGACVNPFVDDDGTPPPPPPPVAKVGALPVGAAEYAVPAGARFVSPSGSDSNPGTQAAPYRTIAAAAQRSASGSTIVLRAGTYRESVHVYRKALTFQSYPGEAVWLSGSDVVTGWVADGTAWRKDGWTPSFERASTSTSHLIDPNHPLAGWPEMVFADGAQLRQVSSRSQVGPGTFYVDDARDQLFVGTNPNGKRMDASAREWGLHFNHADGSKLRGVGVRHYATPLSKIAAVRAFGHRIVVENVVFHDNAASGVSFYAVDGVLRDSTFLRNGQLGVHGLNADRLLVESNLIEDNNLARFDPFQAAGGLKVVRSRQLRFTRNHVLDNGGPGLWTDQSSYDIKITSNLVQRNLRSGIQVELSAKVIAADNVATGNGERGIWVVESNDVDVWNNTLLDNARNLDVLDNTRTSLDLGSHNHDRRFPVPNPNITWDVQRVLVRNNVIGAPRGSTVPAFRVDDVAHRRSAESMAVSSNYNAFYRPTASSPQQLVLWSRWPTKPLISNNLAAHQASTGQDRDSVAVDGGANPWVTNPAALDFRSPSNSRSLTGEALSTPVAQALGLPPGARPRVGVISAIEPNANPVARIEVTCTELDCAFDGSGSTDADGSVDSFSWLLPNGTSPSGRIAAAALPEAGTYTVGLVVGDDRGGQGTTSRTFTVAVTPPPTTQPPPTTTTTEPPTTTTTEPPPTPTTVVSEPSTTTTEPPA